MSNVTSPFCLKGLRDIFSTKVHAGVTTPKVNLEINKLYNVYHRPTKTLYKDLIFKEQNLRSIVFISKEGSATKFYIT